MAVYRTWVCKGCRAPSSDWDPTTLKLVGSGLAIVAFVGLGMTGDKKPRPVTNAVASPSAMLTDQAPEAGLPAAEAAPYDAARLDAIKAEADPDPRPLVADASAPSADDPLILNHDTQVVRQAIAEALESGAPARWRLGQWKGYAVPSEAAQSTGGKCRNVSVTFQDAAKRSHDLPTATFCDQGSGWVRTDR